MAQNKPRKETARALLAKIRKEMALPRMAESTRGKIANPTAAKVAATSL